MGITCKGYPDNNFKKIIAKLDYQMKKDEINKKKFIAKKKTDTAE